MHVHGFDCPNLHYAVHKAGGADDKIEQLAELVAGYATAASRWSMRQRARRRDLRPGLKKAGMRARVYHAGLENETREKAQDRFMPVSST